MKSTTSITLDSEVLIELRRRNIGISRLINDFLKSHLEIIENIPNKEDDLDINILEAKQKLVSLQNEKEKRKKEYDAEMKRRYPRGYKVLESNL